VAIHSGNVIPKGERSAQIQQKFEENKGEVEGAQAR
jgi:hypothetical protein